MVWIENQYGFYACLSRIRKHATYDLRKSSLTVINTNYHFQMKCVSMAWTENQYSSLGLFI